MIVSEIFKNISQKRKQNYSERTENMQRELLQSTIQSQLRHNFNLNFVTR